MSCVDIDLFQQKISSKYLLSACSLFSNSNLIKRDLIRMFGSRLEVRPSRLRRQQEYIVLYLTWLWGFSTCKYFLRTPFKIQQLNTHAHTFSNLMLENHQIIFFRLSTNTTAGFLKHKDLPRHAATENELTQLISDSFGRQW